MGGIRVGRILGFEINIDWSWLLIFFLVVYTLANGYFPRAYPQFNIATNWAVGVLAALLLFTSVLIHELSHSVVARRYGARVKGITLFLFGGVSQTADEPRSPTEEFWMAIVGPLTSFVLALVFYLAGGIGALAAWPAPVVAVLGYLALINFLLGAFNLVPGFPLDGGRVLRSILWGATGNLARATRWASSAGIAVAYAFMAVGFLDILLGAFLGGLWLVFIGWFLAGAARASYQQLQVRQALSGVPVEQVMTAEVPVIPADMTVRSFVDDQLLRREETCYPVTSGGEVIGVVGVEEVRKIPSQEWDRVRLGDIVHSIDGVYKIRADDDAWDALNRLTSEDVCRLIVMEDDNVKGTVGRESVFRLVQTKLRLGM